MTKKKGLIGNALCHVYLIILSVIAVFPLVWVLLSSIKTNGELTSNPTKFIPINPTLENFVHVIQDLDFGVNIANSIVIALSLIHI